MCFFSNFQSTELLHCLLQMPTPGSHTILNSHRLCMTSTGLFQLVSTELSFNIHRFRGQLCSCSSDKNTFDTTSTPVDPAAAVMDVICHQKDYLGAKCQCNQKPETMARDGAGEGRNSSSQEEQGAQGVSRFRRSFSLVKSREEVRRIRNQILPKVEEVLKIV